MFDQMDFAGDSGVKAPNPNQRAAGYAGRWGLRQHSCCNLGDIALRNASRDRVSGFRARELVKGIKPMEGTFGVHPYIEQRKRRGNTSKLSKGLLWH